MAMYCQYECVLKNWLYYIRFYDVISRTFEERNKSMLVKTKDVLNVEKKAPVA